MNNEQQSIQNHYDLIILGSGAGGFAAAIKANELGKKTAMVNAGLPLGGTCVNVGCVPSKTLVHAAELLHHAKHHGVPGLEFEIKEQNFSKVIEDEMNLVKRMRDEKYSKVLTNLEHVTFIDGWSKFVSDKEILVQPSDDSQPQQNLTADKFIIATGSKARVPNVPGLKEAGCLTHIEALQLKEQPKELIVIGGGYVGVELTQVFARFGTKVTILQRRNTILPQVELQLASRLTEILTKEGVDIITDSKIERVEVINDKKIIHYRQDDQEKTVSGDEILIAVGKIPNTGKLNLDVAGVKVTNKRSVEVQPNFQTSKEHIYSVGDVNSLPLRLETTAGREGTLAAENALANTQHIIDYNTVPFTVFTDPQLAGVGITEDKQMELTGSCTCRSVQFTMVPRAIITKQTDGIIKMTINPETKVIEGVHILSANASELISEAMVLIKNKNTIDDVINSLPMFPTLSESLKYVALSFENDISKLSCCV